MQAFAEISTAPTARSQTAVTAILCSMSVPDVTSFTVASVDLLVDFLDGIQVEFGSKPRRDGIVSFQVRMMRRRRPSPAVQSPSLCCAAQIN